MPATIVQCTAKVPKAKCFILAVARDVCVFGAALVHSPAPWGLLVRAPRGGGAADGGPLGEGGGLGGVHIYLAMSTQL